MLKKKAMLAGLMLAVVSMMAFAAEHGASSGTGFSLDDRSLACSSAKSNADMHVPYGATVTGHSSCDCSPSKTGSMTSWTCTVDAYWEKK